MSTPRFVEVPLADWQKVNSELARVREVNAELAAALEASHNQVVTLFCEEFTKTLSPDRCDSVKTTLAVSRAALAKHKAQ